MEIERLKIPKITHTYADSLIAIGMARLLAQLTGGIDQGQVIIKDQGDAFELALEQPLEKDSVTSSSVSPSYPYILLKKNDSAAPKAGEVIDYERQKQLQETYRKYKEAVNKGKKIPQDQIPNEPLPDVQLFKTFNSMRMGSNAYNNLHFAIRNESRMGEVVWNRVEALAGNGAVKVAEPKSLVSAAATLQLFNPVSGKGVHRPKPSGTGAASFPAKLTDWFSEWMKFIAMHLAMVAYRSGDDTKVMVLSPRNIAVSDLQEIRLGLIKAEIWGSVRADIEACLKVSELIVKHSREYAGEKSKLLLANRNPSEIIAGLNVAYFKSLGMASAVMNTSFLGLPGWFPIANREDAEAYLDVIDETRTCLRSLEERHSDDIGLLIQYRDYLSSGRLTDLLEFQAGFGAHVMRRMDQKKWVKRFTTINLRRVFMGLGVNEIIENEGFRNLATAIRKATVNAQFRKAQGTEAFKVHYGLAQEWKRRCRFPEELMKTISQFVQDYNGENARHAELNKERRKNITTQDLDQVFRLIEQDSELTGMLLLAYGYAREPQDRDIPNESEKE